MPKDNTDLKFVYNDHFAVALKKTAEHSGKLYRVVLIFYDTYRDRFDNKMYCNVDNKTLHQIHEWLIMFSKTNEDCMNVTTLCANYICTDIGRLTFNGWFRVDESDEKYYRSEYNKWRKEQNGKQTKE